eukprot:gnl/Chilomastix_cuspidata/5922.p2 GENE.gnl/Chilomastix_cuspidata/5922~~gnl/Chilomastix_cuspidata/5922.p2  ORF type:complete len:129 (-),score=4.36 gnl/Chilomastix_cuspidata/5922:39-425(-)
MGVSFCRKVDTLGPAFLYITRSRPTVTRRRSSRSCRSEIAAAGRYGLKAASLADVRGLGGRMSFFIGEEKVKGGIPCLYGLEMLRIDVCVRSCVRDEVIVLRRGGLIVETERRVFERSKGETAAGREL